MHTEAFEYVRETVAPHLDGITSVLELGSRDVNGSPRALFGPHVDYVGVDIADGPAVDVVADARLWRADRTFDMVVCCEVAEHCKGWAALCVTAFEALRSGGVFVFTAAGPGRAPHSAVDGAALRDGEFYENVEPAMLDAALEAAGFVVWDVDVLGADVRAEAWKAGV